MSANVARHTFHNFVTIAINAACSLLLTAVIARWLEPAGMGAYSLVIWLLAIAGILVNLGTVTTTMKYVSEALGREDRDEAGAVLAQGLRQIGWNGAIVIAAWLLGGPWLAHAYGHHGLGWVLPLAALAIMPSAAMALLMAACQGLQRYDRVALGTAVWGATLVAGTGAALQLGLGVAGLVVAQAFATAAACGVYLRFLATWQPGWWRARMASDRRASLRTYGASLMVLILLDAIVWQRSGVFFLGLWEPAAEVAYYAMAFALAQMAMRMIPGTLVGLLIPSMSRSFGAGDMGQVASIYRAAGRWMAVLAVPVAVGGALLAPALVEVLYGRGYLPMAAPLAVMLAAGAAVMTFGFPASSVLYAVEGQRWLVRVGFVAAAINVALAFWLIPGQGAWGAALATAGAQLASLLPGAWYASRELGGVAPDVRRLPAVLAAAALMAVPVAAAAAWLPPLAALAVGTPGGAIVYALGLWLFRALPPEDRERVTGVAARLPGFKRLAPARS